MGNQLRNAGKKQRVEFRKKTNFLQNYTFLFNLALELIYFHTQLLFLENSTRAKFHSLNLIL